MNKPVVDYLTALFEIYNETPVGKVEKTLSSIMDMANDDKRLDQMDRRRIGSAFLDYIEMDEAAMQDE